MALYYFDSSSMVKLYVQEPGTEQVIRIAASSAANQIATSVLTRLEIRSALTRKLRRNEISRQDSELAMQLLEDHWKSRFVRQPVSDLLLDHACTLLEKHGLRAYDAVQLASCLAIQRTALASQTFVTFVCSDTLLCDAAAAEGLIATDPEDSTDTPL